MMIMMVTFRLGHGECWGEGGKLIEQPWLAQSGPPGGAKFVADPTRFSPLFATLTSSVLSRRP